MKDLYTYLLQAIQEHWFELLFGTGGLIAYFRERKKNKANIERLMEENKSLKIANDKAKVEKENAIMDLYQEALDDLKKRYNETISDVKKYYENKIKLLEDRYKLMEDSYQKKIAELEQTYKDKIEKLKASFDKRLKTLQGRIRELEKELEERSK